MFEKLTSTFHKNRLVLNGITIDPGKPKTLVYDYEVTGPWKEYFHLNKAFKITYSIPITKVPESILVLPLLANVLPLAWIFNAHIHLPVCDGDFFDSIPAFKKGYDQMYPQESFRCRVVADRLEYHKAKGEKSCVMFSGGLDAYTTLIRHIDEAPFLFMIFGADIGIQNKEAIDIAKAQLKAAADRFHLKPYFCKSSFRKVFQKHTMDPLVKEKDGDTWWHGFQHGIGMLSMLAPIAHLKGISTVYMASSFTAADIGHTCASDPTIDNYVRFCGARVIHDGFELNRVMKADTIGKYAIASGKPPFIRACTKSGQADNCCRCEKCIRTILAFYAQGYDPAMFGFTQYQSIDDLGQRLRAKVFRLHKKIRARYLPIQGILRQNFQREALPENLVWLYDTDLEGMKPEELRDAFAKYAPAKDRKKAAREAAK